MSATDLAHDDDDDEEEEEEEDDDDDVTGFFSCHLSTNRLSPYTHGTVRQIIYLNVSEFVSVIKRYIFFQIRAYYRQHRQPK